MVQRVAQLLKELLQGVHLIHTDCGRKRTLFSSCKSPSSKPCPLNSSCVTSLQAQGGAQCVSAASFSGLSGGVLAEKQQPMRFPRKWISHYGNFSQALGRVTSSAQLRGTLVELNNVYSLVLSGRGLVPALKWGCTACGSAPHESTLS